MLVSKISTGDVVHLSLEQRGREINNWVLDSNSIFFDLLFFESIHVLGIVIFLNLSNHIMESIDDSLLGKFITFNSGIAVWMIKLVVVDVGVTLVCI